MTIVLVRPGFSWGCSEGLAGFARIRQKDGMIHGAEPGQILLPSSDSDEPQLDVRRFPEQLREGAHRARGVALGGKMPESLAAPRVETAFARGFHKPGYGLVVRGSEIERFVEFPGAGQFGAARAQAGIVGNLAKAHVMEAGDPHGAFLRDIVERLADLRVRPALGDAEIARRAHRARNPQTKVAIRKEDPSAIFRDEWVVVPHLSADGFDFLSGARREQNERDFSPFEFRQGFFRACKRIRARIDQGAFERGKDQMTRGKQDA